MIKYLKNLLIISTILITANTFAYEAITAEGKQIQEFAENYKKILQYHAGSFTYVKFAMSWPELPEQNVSDNGVAVIGQGSYQAQGGGLSKRLNNSLDATVPTARIDGKPLYGSELYELFEIATLLDSYTDVRKNIIAKAFNNNAKQEKVKNLKGVLVNWQFNLARYMEKYNSMLSVLNKIEPNGQHAIDFNKNYSDVAKTKSQVMAINNLNYMLHIFYRVLSTPEQVDALFNYMAVFIDNGGSPNNNVIVDAALPEEQKLVAFPTAAEAQHELIKDLPITKRTIYSAIANEQQLTNILENKGESYEYFFSKRVANNSQSVQQYADSFKSFVADYTAGYQAEIQARNSNTFKVEGRYGYKNDTVLSGQLGKGTYGATGGEFFTVNYNIAVPYTPGYLHVYTKQMQEERATTGITGQALYGYKLYELFVAAINLEVNSNAIDNVFNRTFTDPKIAKVNNISKLKQALVDFRYNVNKSNLAPSKGLLSVLYNIEPKGISGVDLYKNYSEDAVNATQVQAISKLNAVLENMSQALTAADQDLLFNYIATFVDNGGSKDANVVITQPLDIPEFQKYRPFPTDAEVMTSLIGKNDDYIKPLELTRLSNDEDLKRILGKEYNDLDPRTDDFKAWYLSIAQ